MAKVKHIGSPITRSMAAVAGLFGSSAVPKQVVKRKRENPFQFLEFMFKPKATKAYWNGKLNRARDVKFNSVTGNSGRGALGARQRAVGVHWLKAA